MAEDWRSIGRALAEHWRSIGGALAEHWRSMHWRSTYYCYYYYHFTRPELLTGLGLHIANLERGVTGGIPNCSTPTSKCSWGEHHMIYDILPLLCCKRLCEDSARKQTGAKPSVASRRTSVSSLHGWNTKPPTAHMGSWFSPPSWTGSVSCSSLPGGGGPPCMPHPARCVGRRVSRRGGGTVLPLLPNRKIPRPPTIGPGSARFLPDVRKGFLKR